MLRELTIDGFRVFEHFEMKGLGRVNLLVGANNSGKTSMLEAIELLSSHGAPDVIWRALSQRGERFTGESDRRGSLAVDVCHLFHGHRLEGGSSFWIAGADESGRMGIETSVLEGVRQRTFFDDVEGEMVGHFELELRFTGDSEAMRLPLSRGGGLTYDVARSYSRRPDDSMSPIRFITTASLSVEEIVEHVDAIVLTAHEELVIEAMKTIDATIERIATVAGGTRRVYHPGARGGIVVKCAGVEERLPIGSLGDGIWRILGLALSLARAENGVLLVDEIDTGLHFTAMSDMWRLVTTTAERLNVQVFATTHSRDCVESLATVVRESKADRGEVSIQRIERDQQRSVAFSESEIVIAAERGIEVR